MIYQFRPNQLSSCVLLNGEYTSFIAPFVEKSSQSESEKLSLLSETRSEVLDTSISNEQHHQFLLLHGHSGAPTS